MMLMLMLMQVLDKDQLILLELPQLPTILEQLNQLDRWVSLSKTNADNGWAETLRERSTCSSGTMRPMGLS